MIIYNHINTKNVIKKMETNLHKLIVDGESKYRGQLFTLCNKVLQKDVKIILLCGPSSAGKTTTANLIKSILELKGRKVDVISMDNFFIDLDKREKLPDGRLDFDSPNILNYPLMKECFTKFFTGEKVMFPEYNFKDSVCELEKIPYKYDKNSIIVFEGIHALNPLCIKNLGTENYYRVFVNATTSFKNSAKQMTTKDLRLLRRSVRDLNKRNTSMTRTQEMWDEVTTMEDMYILPYANKVDFFVNSTHEYELGVYKNEINHFIETKQVKPEEVPFKEILNDIAPIPKEVLPETSLMWEFILRPEKKED